MSQKKSKPQSFTKGNYVYIINPIDDKIISVKKIINIIKESKVIKLIETIDSRGVTSIGNEKTIEHWTSNNIGFTLTPSEYKSKFETEYRMCNMKIETYHIMLKYITDGKADNFTNKLTVGKKFNEINKYIKSNHLFIEFIDKIKTL